MPGPLFLALAAASAEESAGSPALLVALMVATGVAGAAAVYALVAARRQRRSGAPAPTAVIPAAAEHRRVEEPQASVGDLPPRLPVAVAPPGPVAVPEYQANGGGVDWERCEIVWWRGYVRSQFLACLVGDAGEVVRESPQFKWRKPDPPPETEDAIAAHAALVEALRRDGWEPEDRNGSWYAQTLRRREPAY